VKSSEIQMRDPFVAVSPGEGKYYLFGTTDPDPWKSPGIGFDAYASADLVNWEGPFPAFRPEPGFWGRKNFWAPEAHAYRGGHYLFASFIAEGRRRGTHVLSSKKIMGPYAPHSEGPVTPPAWECLDGTLHADASGTPWMVFCHEWVQAVDGEVCAVRLSDDLKRAEGDPILLFRASEAPWTAPLERRDGSGKKDARVTDGPFLHRTRSGILLMLWSSLSAKGYAMGVARSSGGVLGPWSQDERPIVDGGGGHGMVFRGLDGVLRISYHRPNDTPLERPVFMEAEETDGPAAGLRLL
jgi:arabinan endo-1,5-alpha-L-arabinosidase